MPDNLQNKITILIADDEEMARAGIRTLLAQAKDLEIIGEAQNGFEVQELIPRLRPKILLLDYKMPGPRPRELEEWVRKSYPETQTLVLTGHDRDAYLTKMIDSGVAGYLLKSQNAEQLIKAIRTAAEGTIYFSEEQIRECSHGRQLFKKNGKA